MRNLTDKEFEIKYNMYKDIIYNIAYTYVHNKDDALDIMQDVFIKYLNSKEEFDNLENEKYYLIRITINESKNNLKSSWKKKVIFNERLDDLISNNTDDERKKYYYIINNLPLKYKEVIILYYYEDLKINEIAQILHKSSDAIKKRLERGRDLIKKEILGDEELRREN